MRGIRFNAVIVLSLVLMGCAQRNAPGIRVEYVDRPIVQVEKCIKKEDRPVRPKSLKEEGLPADLEKLAAIALAKVSEYTRYSNKAELILDSCQN